MTVPIRLSLKFSLNLFFPRFLRITMNVTSTVAVQHCQQNCRLIRINVKHYNIRYNSVQVRVQFKKNNLTFRHNFAISYNYFRITSDYSCART